MKKTIIYFKNGDAIEMDDFGKVTLELNDTVYAFYDDEGNCCHLIATGVLSRVEFLPQD